MLIVDTDNVLHTTGILPPRLAAPGVPGLIRLLASSRYARRNITLVCDGVGLKTSGIKMDLVRILYAGAGREADDVIEHLIRRYHRGNSLDVVSSDRRLRQAARRHNAGSITSECFLKHLVEDEQHPVIRRGNALREQVPLDAYSVDEWLREFGFEPDRKHIGSRTKQKPSRSPSNNPPASSHRPDSIGERLHIEWTPPPVPRTPPESSAAHPPETPEPTKPAEQGIRIDPLLLEALQEWRGRLSLDDLDMQRWLPDE